jgi:hypothetical protein
MASKSQFVSNFRTVATSLIDINAQLSQLREQFTQLAYDATALAGEFGPTTGNPDITVAEFTSAIGTVGQVQTLLTGGTPTTGAHLANLYKLKT